MYFRKKTILQSLLRSSKIQWSCQVVKVTAEKWEEKLRLLWPLCIFDCNLDHGHDKCEVVNFPSRLAESRWLPVLSTMTQQWGTWPPLHSSESSSDESEFLHHISTQGPFCHSGQTNFNGGDNKKSTQGKTACIIVSSWQFSISPFASLQTNLFVIQRIVKIHEIHTYYIAVREEMSINCVIKIQSRVKNTDNFLLHYLGTVLPENSISEEIHKRICMETELTSWIQAL